MKWLFMLLLAFAPLAKAALIANVVTDRGTIVVELQHAKTPKTVANFITMAEGTRTRLDAKSGEVINAPLYVGEKFFRVVNDAGFKIIQTGSGTGDTQGVPGFTFKDEFDPALTHVPYVLSMANAGPNTNGGQIFFTGNATITSLNNVHTVFGLITDAPSRTVIDAILTAGANATTIMGVTFQRTDAPAIAFGELAQGLPTIEVPEGSLAVSMGQSSTWSFQAAIEPGTIFRAFRSNTLAGGSWAELSNARRQIGLGSAGNLPTLASVQLDTAPAATAFYHLSTASHPGALTPGNLESRVVVVNIGTSVATYTFNAAGNGGSVVVAPASGTPLNATFITVDRLLGTPELPRCEGGYDMAFVAQHTGLTPREVYYRIGCDSANETQITGRYSALSRSGFPFGFTTFNSGLAGITR